MKIIFLPEVLEQFLELAEILYDKGYMSFREHAEEYMETLFQDINSSLPHKVHRKAPRWFDRYGEDMSYSVFPKNDNTTWYVFFNVYEIGEETTYIVRYLSNNHVIAHHLELDN